MVELDGLNPEWSKRVKNIHCRYKTTQGMNNHMASAHNKQAVSSSGEISK